MLFLVCHVYIFNLDFSTKVLDTKYDKINRTNGQR
jgi:hypothetical protein